MTGITLLLLFLGLVALVFDRISKSKYFYKYTAIALASTALLFQLTLLISK